MKHERRLRSARRLILLTFLGLVIALEIACGFFRGIRPAKRLTSERLYCLF